MSDLRQAAQQALEALIPLANAASPNERECLTDEDHERAAAAVEALEQALAEPEQEPVAFIGTDGELGWLNKPNTLRSAATPLYTAPTPRKPLTDEEIAQISVECAATHKHDDLAFARAIEKAHGIGKSK